MNVLIVGGAGDVGAILRQALEARYDCYHYDLRPVPGSESRTRIGDINDEHGLRAALAGMQAVVHLAMGSGPRKRKDVNDIEAAFGVNAQGTYRLLDEAMRAGVRRVVYASSLSVYEKLGRDHRRYDESVPATAWHAYGLTKRLGEVVCEHACRQWPDAGVVALRLMQPCNDHDWPGNEYKPGGFWYPLGPEDTRRLCIAALERTATPGFVLAQATGDLGGEVYPHHQAAELLGWRPEGRLISDF